MIATNLILLLALGFMVGIAVWLFKDGEGVGPAPMIRPPDGNEDTEDEGSDRAGQVRVRINNADDEQIDQVGRGRDA